MLDQILADESNNNIFWTLTDNLGTVRDLVNSAGVVQDHLKIVDRCPQFKLQSCRTRLKTRLTQKNNNGSGSNFSGWTRYADEI
jgi:hypothetical protein